ncbi:MAG: signal peptidase I, partial [Bdellovibrionales bacterium]|nr:signal peptidase I [Bdellovibrionales bacterium]
YVLVKKWAYGVRIPFSNNWLIGPSIPKRGDIVVFKSKDDDFHFLVKRVVGLPGDELQINDQGRISVNGIAWQYDSTPSDDNEVLAFQENNQFKSYSVQYDEGTNDALFETTVPEGHVFLMGDNRHHSMDSRYWGALPVERLLGKVSVIWFSCGESENSSGFLCPPDVIRWDRIKQVQ